MRSPALVVLASVSLALLLAAQSGCQRHVQSICRQSCECEPCTDADLDDCIDRGTAALDMAEKKDCGPKVDAYLACVDETLSCRHGSGGGTDACGKEEEALTACTGTGNPFATPCQQAAQKNAECFGQPLPPGAGSDQCPPEQACQSMCVLSASCDVIIGNQFDPGFQDCFNACFSK